jgi:drug/metabolite transporter (DMT)-like permease
MRIALFESEPRTSEALWPLKAVRAFWLWFPALGQLELSRANAFTFLEPILGLSIGEMSVGERLGWPQAVGVAPAIVAVVLAQFRGMASSRPEWAD